MYRKQGHQPLPVSFHYGIYLSKLLKFEGYRLNDWSSIPGRANNGFFSSLCPDWLWGQPNLPPNRYQGDLTPGVEWPGCEAYHSPPSSVEVKNAWSYIPLPQYIIMV
jgi:hypothetical protein